MNRIEFMNQLESLLADISKSEREEALQYYNDYLNDAGVENEEEVLGTLGTPEELAKVIKEGLGDNSNAGEFSETGYKNSYYETEEKKEVAKKEEKERMSGGMVALIVVLCIFAAPVLAAVASGLFGAGLGIFGAIVGTLFGIGVTGVVLFIVSLILIGAGIGELFVIPLAGVCMIGAGILLGGLSLFFIWLTVWICGVAIPWIVRGICSICRKLFHKKGGENE